jgi:hypothetical protein
MLLRPSTMLFEIEGVGLGCFCYNHNSLLPGVLPGRGGRFRVGPGLRNSALDSLMSREHGVDIHHFPTLLGISEVSLIRSRG